VGGDRRLAQKAANREEAVDRGRPTGEMDSRFVRTYNFKVFSEQILKVNDWRAFWAANRQKTLAQIHEPIKPLVDQYWKEHGTTQIVK
jgi:hypothetical protein